MNDALERVLVSKDVLLKHPGQTQIGSWYASPSEAQTHLSEANNSSGRIRVTSNSLSFSASSNFQISASSLVYGLTLNATLTTPANTVIATSGWLFDCIRSIEFTISNSLISNQIITGPIMREYLLLSCTDEEQRSNLLKMGGEPVAAATQASASIPIAWLLQGGNGLCSHFPLDFSTLNGPFQIQITFNPSSYILSRTGAAPGTIASFDALNITACTTDIIEPALGVRNALLSNPGMVYPIPCKYFSCVRYVQSCTIGSLATMNLNSAPAGMLEGIIISVKPSVETSANADGTVNYAGSCQLSTLRLQYMGVDLFRADSPKELESYYRTRFCGDAKENQWRFQDANTVNAANADLIEGHSYFIPLTYEADAVLSEKKQEHLPSYGGVNLQLSFTPAARTQFDTSAGVIFPVALNPRGGAGAQDYNIDIGWMVSAILEVGGGNVNLVM